MSALLPALAWDTGAYEVNKKLGQFVQYFQVNLPVTNTGVPLKLVNPAGLIDALIDCETTDDVPEEVLENTLMEVDFADGYPMVDGVPIWERFDGEKMDYYKLFKEYRDMVALTGTRALARLSEKYDIPGKVFSVLSKVYHWQLRCKLFDAYTAMVAARKRAYEVERLENKHANAAASILERGLAYLEAHPEQLNPKVALQMVEVGMKAGRLSLGLAGDKASGTPATQINISQSAATGGGSAEIVQETTAIKTSMQGDTDYLQSVIHILETSGALDKAKSEVIDATFEEVKSTEEAVEGA